jgi:hypothetical protein
MSKEQSCHFKSLIAFESQTFVRPKTRASNSRLCSPKRWTKFRLDLWIYLVRKDLYQTDIKTYTNSGRRTPTWGCALVILNKCSNNWTSARSRIIKQIELTHKTREFKSGWNKFGRSSTARSICSASEWLSARSEATLIAREENSSLWINLSRVANVSVEITVKS